MPPKVNRKPKNVRSSFSATLPRVEGREWWLWGFAVAVTLVLTFAIFTLTVTDIRLYSDKVSSLNLKEWVRGLTALVLLFDVYTIYQHSQLQRIRRQLAERDRLFQLITENAADMIAVIDNHGDRIYNSPAYYKVLGYSQRELTGPRRSNRFTPTIAPE